MIANNIEIYSNFESWLDNLLENNEMPVNTKAFNFNLYVEEEGEYVYGVQIIASDRFDADDDEWACCEIWSSEEDVFCVSTADETDKSRKQLQKFVAKMISIYLEDGKYKDILLKSDGIGIGFVDGELEIIFKP